MSPAVFYALTLAIRILGAVIVTTLGVVAIYMLRQARQGVYYVVREKARARGLRLALFAALVGLVSFGLAALVDSLVARSVTVAQVTQTPSPTATWHSPTATFTATGTAVPTDTPVPRPTATPLPVPTATASPTRIPPTDLPPTLLTPVPSAVPAAETAGFGPIQVGSGYVNYQLAGIGNTFPRDTPIIHATFLVRNMNSRAVWTAAWYRDGKYVAGDPLLWNSPPNTVGHVFYGQPGGFRPGKWELRLYIEDRLQNKAGFTILSATSTPTVTPTPTAVPSGTAFPQ